MKTPAATSTPPALRPGDTPAQRPLRIPKEVDVSPQQVTAGLMLLGPLSIVPTVAVLAEDCVSLGEHAPGSSDFFASALELCARVHKGDMQPVETMLMNQALSLNLLSNAMMSRATRNIGTNLDKVESYMRLALKAQNQSRMTLETLSNVKNPPVVYAKQANINNGGQQQVNNGPSPVASATHTADARTEKTELLEQQHGQRLDTREASASGRADTHLAAVGAVDGAAKRRRKA